MPSSMDDLFSFLTQLMTQHASIFETMGQNMFRGFSIVLVCWYGIKSALSAASGGPMNGFNFDNFGELLLQIAFGFAMMTYYSQPIPGIGISFYHLIVDQGLNLSNQLNHSLVQEVWDRLNGIYFGMEMPGKRSSTNARTRAALIVASRSRAAHAAPRTAIQSGLS